MDVLGIAPGLKYWTAPHPSWNGAADWPEDVGWVYFEAPEAVVLIDPLVPRSGEDEFWQTLDRCIERVGLPVAVLLTAPWHERSAPAVAARYGTVVWAHEAGRGRLSCSSHSGPLPTGVELFVPGGLDDGQVAFFLRSHGALVVAEFFMGVEGGLRVCPSPALRERKAFDD
jgi:hypothetical protein